jgi:hypothetical protein
MNLEDYNMPLPKKIKKYIPLEPQKTLIGRRYELAEKIAEKGTYLPKSLLHADLDKGMLDFVKEDLKLVVTGKEVPVVDILITTQNWAQFTETWNFQDLDKNASPPFITVVRVPEVKFGTNPAVLYNIPNRKQYYYAVVPTWDGQRKGADIYKIPQPVPVDITYSVKIVCNRMRELNKFNQIILEKFASIQAYRNIKGHYIPIKMGNISDESTMDIEKRKYYVQSYEFIMLGFLIDEEEFEISPAISRQLTLLEVDLKTPKKRQEKKLPENPDKFILNFDFDAGSTIYEKVFEYTSNLTLFDKKNVESYDVYINDDFYGSDISTIQINTNDKLRVEIVPSDDSKNSVIIFDCKLL